MAGKFVKVTGITVDTEPHELTKLFTQFGVVQVVKMYSGMAILHFNHELDARKALESRMVLFGNKMVKIKPMDHMKALRAVTHTTIPINHQFHKHRRHAFTGTQFADDIIHPTKIYLTGDFYNQMMNVLANVCLTREEVGRTALLYEQVQLTLQRQWPDCKAFAFGSITTGLGIKSSDADCFVLLPQFVRNHRDPHNIIRAKNVLATRPDLFTDLIAIPQANTPIVKLLHKPTQMRCDISMKNCMSLRNSELIKFLLQTDERLLNIAIVIKYWGKTHGLTGTGRLSNYALIMLYIFYLQQHHIAVLPSIRSMKTYPMFVECWDTSFMYNPHKLPRTPNKATIPELMGGFYQYYASFNFSKYVVSPYMGLPIEREKFHCGDLPEGFELYKKNLNNKYCLPLKISSPICIQDPFEQSRNISSGVSNKLSVELQKYFKFAAEAFYNARANNHLEFLRTVLLSKPEIMPSKDTNFQVMIPRRFLQMPQTIDWQSHFKNVFETIFVKILKIKLTNQSERENRCNIHVKYKIDLERCPWSNRMRYENTYDAKKHTFLEMQEKITDRVLDENSTVLNSTVTAHVMLFSFKKVVTSYCFEMGEDYDAFKEFSTFLKENFAIWCRELLKAQNMTLDKNEGRTSLPNEEDASTNNAIDKSNKLVNIECESKTITAADILLQPITDKCINYDAHAASSAENSMVSNEIPQLTSAVGTQSPAAARTQSPTAARIRSPAAARTQSPAAARTQSPAAARTQSPAAARIRSPAAARIRRPAAARTQSPAAARTQSPAAARTQSPAAARTQSPAAARTQSPAAARTQSPAAARTRSRAAARIRRPAAARTQSPAAARTQSPAAARTQSPAAARTQSPAAARTQSPAAARTQSPAAARTQSPAAARTQSPAAARTQSPAADSEMLPQKESPTKKIKYLKTKIFTSHNLRSNKASTSAAFNFAASSQSSDENRDPAETTNLYKPVSSTPTSPVKTKTTSTSFSTILL